jgi:glycosyltransferase involved in cell wall biosynthesis
MRLLFSANSFYPAVGGYERVAFILANEMAARGHSVKVITFTPAEQDVALPFEIYRSPGIGTFFRLLRWSEIYIQHNVSFKTLWPVILCWRPLVYLHHGFYEDKLHPWRPRLKHLLTFFGTNISVSKAVAESMPAKSYVIPNPYRDDAFFPIPNASRDRDLFFVGRIVSDKGIDVLIDALAKLRDRGMQPTLTIAGAGPEEGAIRHRVERLSLTDQVTFAGRVSDEKLNELLNTHRIMIVPTREGEGFGVVALEGIACGCVVVGSTCGGLPEAIGPCGKIFTNGDSSALADVLHDLLARPETWNRFFGAAKAHLETHRPSFVADKYAEVFEKVVGARR